MQYRCNIEALEMLYKRIASVLYSYLTFMDRVGWVGGVVGEMGSKAISAFNSVEVEVDILAFRRADARLMLICNSDRV